MRTQFLLFTLMLSFLGGCSGSTGTNPVRGKVMYQGQPAVGALVLFHPANDPNGLANKPYATVSADGTFVLTTFSNQPDGGAPAGEYKVTVAWPQEATPKTPKPGEPIQMGGNEKAEGTAPDKLRGKYSQKATTPLSATIKSGTNELPPFELN
ncbi:MAG: hypothetical protein ACRCZF_28445 [Gemmataceae bacterium]